MLADQNLKVASRIDQLKSEIVLNQYESLLAMRSHLDKIDCQLDSLDAFIEEIESYKKELSENI